MSFLNISFKLDVRQVSVQLIMTFFGKMSTSIHCMMLVERCVRKPYSRPKVLFCYNDYARNEISCHLIIDRTYLILLYSRCGALTLPRDATLTANQKINLY